jgi:hypothetical protein
MSSEFTKEEVIKMLGYQRQADADRITELSKEFQGVRDAVLIHLEESKAVRCKVDALHDQINKDNGHDCIKTSVDKLWRYVYMVIGGSAVIGILWTALTLFVPLVVKK